MNHFGSAVQVLQMASYGVKTVKGLQSSAEVVDVDEVVEVSAKLVVCVVVEALDGCVLERSVHPFDLAIGPRVVRLGQPVIDVVLSTSVFERVGTERLRAVHGVPDL